jgi:uncharacterized membrane protein YeiH
MDNRSFHLPIGNADRDDPDQVVRGLYLDKRRVVVDSDEWGIRMSRRIAIGKERAVIRDALSGSFELPVYFDYPATFIWALSGAVLAARLRMDPTGVALIALVTAAGGGLLRDGLFLQIGPPALIRTPVYIILIGIAVVIVILAGARVLHFRHFDQIVVLIDLFGLGTYAIVGLELSLSVGLSVLAAIFVGTVNAVGGGLLRDIILRRTPELLQPGSPITIVAIAGCVAYAVMTRLFGLPGGLAGLSAIFLVLLIRTVALRLGLRTAPIPGFPQADDE